MHILQKKHHILSRITLGQTFDVELEIFLEMMMEALITSDRVFSPYSHILSKSVGGVKFL